MTTTVVQITAHGETLTELTLAHAAALAAFLDGQEGLFIEETQTGIAAKTLTEDGRCFESTKAYTVSTEPIPESEFPILNGPLGTLTHN